MTKFQRWLLLLDDVTLGVALAIFVLPILVALLAILVDLFGNP